MLQNYVNNELPLRRPKEVVLLLLLLLQQTYSKTIIIFTYKADFEGLKGLH